jgi:hypothetical protein
MVKFLQKRSRFVGDIEMEFNDIRIPKQKDEKPKQGDLFPMVLYLCMAWSVFIGSASMYYFLTHESKLIGVTILITLPILWVVAVKTVKGELE